VRGEAGEALSRGILVPALIEETRIPLEFRRFHAANLVDWQGGLDHMELQTLLSEVQGFVVHIPTPQVEPVTPAAGASAELPNPGASIAASPPSPAPRGAPWSAELLTQDSARRLLRVALSGDTHVVDYKNQFSAEVVSVDGMEVTRGGSTFQFVGHHEFEIPDGDRQRPAVIDATVHWLRGIDAFRLQVDGQTVYTEGELPDA
jgi:hypothetical protein